MVTRFRAWLSQALDNLSIIGREPVLTITLAIEGLTAYQNARAGGFGWEDAIMAGVIAVLGLLGRQLVYPAVKVDASTSALKVVDEVLAAPYIPEGG